MRTPPFSTAFKKLHPWFGEASLIHFALIEGRQRRQFLLCHTGFPRISATWQALLDHFLLPSTISCHQGVTTTSTTGPVATKSPNRSSSPPPRVCTSLILCSRWICRPISATRTNGKKCGQFKRAAARRIYHENPIKSGQRSVWVGEGAWQRWQREREMQKPWLLHVETFVHRIFGQIDLKTNQGRF